MTKIKSAIIISSLLLLCSCETETTQSEYSLSDVNVFVLCEGNFGHDNASLWKINLNDFLATGPVYQGLTGQLLGDVGQSIAIHDNKLYVVINNSHKVEIFNLED